MPESVARSLLLTGPSGDDLHLSRLGKRMLLECSGVETDAGQLWVRRDKDGGPVRKLALTDSSRLVVNGKALLAAEGLKAISLSFQDDGIHGCLECDGEFRLRLLAPGFKRAKLADKRIAIQHEGELAVIASRADGLVQFSLMR